MCLRVHYVLKVGEFVVAVLFPLFGQRISGLNYHINSFNVRNMNFKFTYIVKCQDRYKNRLCQGKTLSIFLYQK